MDLVDLLPRYPRQLAGGDQQKVSLARAIVRRPAIYLMDEPLGTLDADQRLVMREFIRGVQLESKVPTIYVTHDQEEAMSLADRIVVMSAGEIRQVGTPAEVYDRPADLFVANFVGSPGMNFIAGQMQPNGAGAVFVSEAGGVRIPLGRAARPGKAVLGIRCEHLRDDPAGPLAGSVVMDEYLGSARIVHVSGEFGRLVMRVPAHVAHGLGASVRLGLDPAHVNVFDPQTEKRL
jgi:ABC-type sugar transport system ATPase subunit